MQPSPQSGKRSLTQLASMPSRPMLPDAAEDEESAEAEETELAAAGVSCGWISGGASRGSDFGS
jgi:hypothetical protein